MNQRPINSGLLFLLAALICLNISGCATSPKANFYTLSVATEGENLCSTTAEPIVIMTEILNFPDLLTQPQIATRPQKNRIEYAEFHRWAGSLESDFSQSLSKNLQLFCRNTQVIQDLWPGVKPPDYQLYLEVIRFDGKLGDHVTLATNWILTGKGLNDTRLERQSEISVPITENGFNSLVAAQSQAVEMLAREILQALESIKQP